MALLKATLQRKAEIIVSITEFSIFSFIGFVIIVIGAKGV